MKENILDLSNIYGYARLYRTLSADGVIGSRTLADKMYGWYCSNIAAYNKKNGGGLVPLEAEIFFYKLNTAHVQPYKTDIQTIKALELLNDNNLRSPEYLDDVLYLDDKYLRHLDEFQKKHGCCAHDAVTSYSLCENTLDPDYEPESELNPAAFLRKYEEGPKLVYISAPLRGDVEKNIEFARSKAKEVFANGNIPICPHLMFPPIADPNNPKEDKAAMEMCLKLLDRCNEMHVYGNEWTEGMWREIRHAERVRIPVLTDQERVPKSKAIQNDSKKKKLPCR